MHLRKMRRHSKSILFYALSLISVLAVVGLFVVITTIASLPPLDLLQSRQVSQSTKIFDRTGSILLYEVYGEEKRTLISFDEIPANAKNATIAIEDAEFYEHSAIDVSSLIRAQLSNIKVFLGGSGLIQGGSTITQQLAKKAFLSDERTLTRKLKEVFLAYKLENTFSKDKILELYLNQIPYGNNAYGIEAAAQTYFQKSVRDLTLAQTALLTSLPQAPSYYDPFGRHVQDLLSRKNLVLRRMASVGSITEEQRVAAEKEVLVFSQLKKLETAPHFVLAIKEYLENQYGEEFVRRAGLRVITTLDVPLQKIAEKAVVAGAARNAELYKGTNAAMVVSDPKTGQILAMVGSRNYFDKEIDGQFNVAAQGMRQPGSTLKPFIYLAAIEQGYPPSTIFFDVPTEFYPNAKECPISPPFKDQEGGSDSRCFHPQNFDHDFLGPVPMRAALAQSRNIPAVKALYLVSIPQTLSFLQKIGITTLTDPSRYGLSLVLGGGEVHLDELVGAYGVLAQEGVRHEPSMIISITDQGGRLLEAYKNKATPVVEAESARAINDILRDPEARRPLFANSLGLTVFDGYDVALKTGTTNDYRDAWSVGYTPNLVVGVWAGNNDNKPMQQQGGSILAAVPILSSFLREALPLTQAEAFTAPSIEKANKPMLNGQYMAYFQSGSQILPHVHDILYYVSKRNPLGPMPTNPESDPQFLNWETPVLSWATSTISGSVLGQTLNAPLPIGATLVVQEEKPTIEEANAQPSGSGIIVLTSPKPGSFMRGDTVLLNASIVSQTEISKIEVYFNGSLVDSRTGQLGKTIQYQNSLLVPSPQPQNSLKIIATDVLGRILQNEAIIYK